MPYIPMSPYAPETDFSDDEDQGVGGRSTLDNSSLDAEFAALVVSTEALRNNLELIQRSDGRLEDLLVEPENLSKATLTLLSTNVNVRGAWFTATAYKINDLIKEAGITYVAVEDHTSGVFLDDLAQLKWIDFGGDLSAPEIKTAYESNPDTNVFDDAAESKLGGIEPLADVTNNASVLAAGALMDSEVDANLKTLVLPANTTISTLGASLVDDDNAGVMRGTLGLVIGTNVLPELPLITQALAEAGAETTEKIWSSLRVRQAVQASPTYIQTQIAGSPTDLEVEADVALIHIPFARKLTAVHAEVDTAGTTGVTTIDINRNGTSMLSTKLTIDSGETGSDTANDPAVIDTGEDDTAVNDVITIDIDGISSTAPKGLSVTMTFENS